MSAILYIINPNKFFYKGKEFLKANINYNEKLKLLIKILLFYEFEIQNKGI
jgi:hypothetical protein